MANKYWRKCMRPGLLFFCVVAQGRVGGSIRQLRRRDKQDHHVQQLWQLHSLAPTPKSTTPTSHCLPIPTPGCLPLPSYSSLPSSPDAIHEEEYLNHTALICTDIDNPMMMTQKELARTHSCSKLQGLVPSLKSMLLHRSNSHSHLHTPRHSHNYHHPHTSPPNNGAAKDITRSWSTPSLQRRHCQSANLHQKAGSFSCHTEHEGSGNCSIGGKSGKRTPKGHVAVYVESGKQRWVVPISYLSHPYFEALLQRAESEFGFRQKGGLTIPCSLRELQETLNRIQSDQPACA